MVPLEACTPPGCRYHLLNKSTLLPRATEMVVFVSFVIVEFLSPRGILVHSRCSELSDGGAWQK